MHPACRPVPLVAASTATVARAATNNAPAATTATRPTRVQRKGSDRRLFWSIMTIVRTSVGMVPMGADGAESAVGHDVRQVQLTRRASLLVPFGVGQAGLEVE